MSQICGQLRPDRQTLLFSATFNERLEAAVGDWIRAPVRIYAESAPDKGSEGHVDALDGAGEGAAAGESAALPPPSVEQRFVLCEKGGKRAALLEELLALGSARVAATKPASWFAAAAAAEAGEGGSAKPRNMPRTLVFVNTIKAMRELAISLRKGGVRCETLHGEKAQREREDALANFRSGKVPVLLCSDVAARGIDIPKLPAVINYDPPASLTHYTHRLGRTGRQGAHGVVITLLRHDPASVHFAAEARSLLQRMGRPLPADLASLAAEAATPPVRPVGSGQIPSSPPPAAGVGPSLLDFAANFA